MYKIQLRDLVAMHLIGAWRSANEIDIRAAFKAADRFLKVRLEPTE